MSMKKQPLTTLKAGSVDFEGTRAPARVVTMAMTEEDAKLLINVIRATPVQGNLQTLPQMITRLMALQEKLEKAING